MNNLHNWLDSIKSEVDSLAHYFKRYNLSQAEFEEVLKDIKHSIGNIEENLKRIKLWLPDTP
jgi:serine/threonine-protein kinase RIO1